MASPTKYTTDAPYEDTNGDLVIPVRIKNADPKSKERIIVGLPALVAAFPAKGWLGILRVASTLGALFA